ncbi:lipase chaperone family protein [Paracidovorax konjaci]|uniref:Lipase helper protein n=1 Tax=Paracidovorax konjaci TaxID=32040 RepID=A0A1I1VNB1_9BURK|nr:lipase chaperone family protein [Paracidovorax konjaci]SFD82553.1 Lipase chaperone LimK [Paracidovorax konjaci]
MASGRQVGAALCAAAALGVAGWLAAGTPAGGQGTAGSSGSPGSLGAGTPAPRPPAGPDPRFLAPRSAAELALPQADPLLGPTLRDDLEALLQEALEAGATVDPAALKRRLPGLVDRHFAAGLRERALLLAGRYVDYRAALGGLQPPADLNDPQALRASMDARDRLRRACFEPAEYEALFAGEAELDRHTLARLEILQGSASTRGEKAQALRAAEASLPEAMRAARASYAAPLAVAEQTAALDARQADDATRHAERSARYGEAAAQALARLDGEERQWQQRLDQYQQALATQGDGPALQQLQQQLFTPQERMRLEGALALRAARPVPATAAAGH